jgi:lycopene cyclase domain-containing protein
VATVSYTALALVGALVAVLVDLALLRTNLLRHKAFWAAYLIVLFFQLVTNGLLTGIPVVRYDPQTIIGWRLAFAPVEDLLFGFAMMVVTLATWVWLGARPPRGADH